MVHFQTFFVDFSCEITEKALKWTKKVEKRLKKRFRPALGCAQHPKAGRNTQQIQIGHTMDKQQTHNPSFLSYQSNPNLSGVPNIFLYVELLLVNFCNKINYLHASRDTFLFTFKCSICICPLMLDKFLDCDLNIEYMLPVSCST